MTNYARIEHPVDGERGKIIMDRTFAKNAKIVGSKEYNQLQRAMRDYPKYDVVTRQIKKKSGQEHYADLTYDYMREYILTFEPAETLDEALAEFSRLQRKSDKNKKSRYPAVKKWFIEQYPEVKDVGARSIDEILRSRTPNRLPSIIVFKKGA